MSESARHELSFMNYKLFFRGLEIGIVTQNDQDCTNYYGKYTLTSDPYGLIVRYIDYSIRASAVYEVDESGWNDFMESEEAEFEELLNPDNWLMLDEQGRLHQIMVPVFYKDAEMVWRWKFD